MSKQPFYVTTPIYYCNDVPHIGHAYTTIAADALARYHRLKGDPTFFLTGTDEHGQKVEKAAEAGGKTPKQFVDEIAPQFKNLWQDFRISNDRFIRTTDKDHLAVVADMWKRMTEAGDIFLGEYEAWYCVHDETFWTEGQVEEGGLCPNAWCRRPVEKHKEKSYFFKLSKYTEPLLDYYEKHPDFVLPEYRMNEVKSFVSQGLNDLSISRTTFDWGVPVPNDDDHVVYVWLDALTNYLTGIGFGRDENKYNQFWPANVHLVGKDILRFHAIFWPAFLMSAGLPLPEHVFAHGFWNVDDQKMSKSLGNRIDPKEMVDIFGLDAVRYFLMREIPLGADGNFSMKAIEGRINADLANDLGNLLSRSLAMTDKYLKGVVPAATAADSPLAVACLEAEQRYRAAFDAFLPSKALVAVWEAISRANKYIDERAPWTLAKDDNKAEELAGVMYDLLEALRRVAAMVWPIMPDSSEEIYRQLGLDPADIGPLSLGDWGGMAPGNVIKRAKSLFPRFDLDAYNKSKGGDAAKAEPKKAESAASEPKKQTVEGVAEIEFEDFTKLSMKVGRIESAERVPKTDKLIHVTVDTGEKRDIVAGIAEHYAPEDLVGKTVIVLTNLKPRKLKGILSQGMMLASKNADGVLRLLTTDGDQTPGSKIS